jgi:ribosome-binding protein aMBF1 (putative translation factor)
MVESIVVDPTPEEDRDLLEAQHAAESEREEMIDVGRALRDRLRRLGDMLRETREAEGLTVAELSDRTGIDEDELLRLEAGCRNVTINLLDRYSAGLGRELSIRLEEAA